MFEVFIALSARHKRYHRHYHIVDKRGHDFAERAADDHTDSHVYNVALHGKLFEIR